MTWPRQKTTEELRAEWAANRQRVADRWFRGDTDLAEDVLNALPYSEIPDWSSLDMVMEAINQSGDLEPSHWLAAHDREVAARTLRELHAEMSTDWHVYETRDIGRAFLADSVLERLEDAADAIERGEDV